MATEEEVKPAKRGRGRPPKAESEKKAAKRKAEPAVDEEGNPVVKKGRGRPPGSGGKKAKKAGKAGKGVSEPAVRYYVVFPVTWLRTFWLKFDQIYCQSGKGRGRPKKNAEPEVSKEM